MYRNRKYYFLMNESLIENIGILCPSIRNLKFGKLFKRQNLYVPDTKYDVEKLFIYSIQVEMKVQSVESNISLMKNLKQERPNSNTNKQSFKNANNLKMINEICYFVVCWITSLMRLPIFLILELREKQFQFFS